MVVVVVVVYMLSPLTPNVIQSSQRFAIRRLAEVTISGLDHLDRCPGHPSDQEDVYACHEHFGDL